MTRFSRIIQFCILQQAEKKEHRSDKALRIRHLLENLNLGYQEWLLEEGTSENFDLCVLQEKLVFLIPFFVHSLALRALF